MSVRRAIVLAALWLASLIVVSTWTAAQARNDATPTAYAGENFGFRASQPGGKEGVLVIRINGQWVEAQLSARVSPVKKN
jgi:hypothetical protein